MSPTAAIERSGSTAPESGRAPGAAARVRGVTFLFRALLLALVYVAFARLGLRLHAVSSFATLVWAPTGISLVALLTLGTRYWPAIAAGAFAANLWNGAPLPVALGIAAGNTLEAVGGVWMLRRIPGFSPELEKLRDVLGLVTLGAVGSSAISATVGVLSLRAGGIVSADSLAVTWRAWWLGDAIGDLVLAPLLLTWRGRRAGTPRARRLAESALLAVLLAATSYSIFEASEFKIPSLLAPLLIWAAIRFELRGAARATFLVSLVAIEGTLRGHGPFVQPTVEESLFALQAFMAVTAATFLVLGAVTRERRRAEADREAAQDRIRDSERRYRSLAEAVHQLLWIEDRDGRKVYVNKRWEETVGGTEFSEGRSWTDGVHPEERKILRDLRRTRAAAGQPYEAEFRLRMRDGGYRWMLARLVPVKGDDGAVVSWFGAAADVDELKAAQTELRRARDEAETANRAKDQFLAALSHELRTPLTPVLALSSALERDAALPAEARRRLGIVRRNAELEARLIDDLLDLTRIERGKLDLRLEPHRLESILDRVVEICREEALEKGVSLERPGSTASVVRADAARLMQVFWNLVKNAIKFTPRGGRVVVTTLAAGPDRVAIEVSDTGSGIVPSALTRIFRPFEQAGSTGGGLGLGLAISSTLVEAHGGCLSASSEGPGRGATFRVELETTEPPPAPVASPDRREGERSGVPRRVLLIDDHADTLAAARELLTELSCEVVSASSFAEAFAAAENHSFDLVVSDVGLPDGSGLELMRRLRERHGLAGIAVSGYGTTEDLARSREAGFVEHLVKPITFERLEDAIERFFRRGPA
jgi:PAS domain S-box-containing protein